MESSPRGLLYRDANASGVPWDRAPIHNAWASSWDFLMFVPWNFLEAVRYAIL